MFTNKGLKVMFMLRVLRSLNYLITEIYTIRMLLDSENSNEECKTLLQANDKLMDTISKEWKR